jgi:hypothetical protein
VARITSCRSLSHPPLSRFGRFRLSKIDSQTRGDHWQPDVSDEGNIYYWREYTAQKDHSFSETNNLIKNFKITPAQKRANPSRSQYKERSLHLLAGKVDKFIIPTVVKDGATIVPIPPSRIIGDPDHDDRLIRLLRKACGNQSVDIRSAIVHTQGTKADHEGDNRLSFAERMALTTVDPSLITPIPKWAVIFDNMLTKGTHCKVAKALLAQVWPGVPVVGVFISRRVQPPVEFPNLDE